MSLKRLVTAAVLALTLSLGLSDRVRAAYDVTTSVPTALITLNGGSPGVVTTVPAGTVIVPGVTAVNGGVSFVDAAGSTIYLLNYSSLNFTGSNIPNEQVFVTSSAVSDSATFGFTVNIRVTNPSGSIIPANTGTFTETANYNLVVATTGGVTSGTYAFTPIGGNPTLGAPTSITVGGQTFAISNPRANDGTVNNPNNAGISATITPLGVPEPASIAMLGLGLIGLGGVAFRQRRRQARTD